MRRVLITGGGSGIGAADGAATRQRRRSGHDLRPHSGDAREDASRSTGAHALQCVVLDVADEAAVANLFRSHEFDAVVCAAGIIKTADVFELSPADFRSRARRQSHGHVSRVPRSHATAARTRRAWRYVTISSLAGIRGMQVRFPGSFSYVAAKHAVAGLSEALAIDGRPFGIRVNCISPRPRRYGDRAPIRRHPGDQADADRSVDRKPAGPRAHGRPVGQQYRGLFP